MQEAPGGQKPIIPHLSVVGAIIPQQIRLDGFQLDAVRLESCPARIMTIYLFHSSLFLSYFLLNDLNDHGRHLYILFRIFLGCGRCGLTHQILFCHVVQRILAQVYHTILKWCRWFDLTTLLEGCFSRTGEAAAVWVVQPWWLECFQVERWQWSCLQAQRSPDKVCQMLESEAVWWWWSQLRGHIFCRDTWCLVAGQQSKVPFFPMNLLITGNMDTGWTCFSLLFFG